MAEAIESYRGGVKAWECDMFGHFTVAYYFEHVAEASAAALAALAPGERWQARSYLSRYREELRAGDGFHVMTAVAAREGENLTLVHEIVNSVSGQVATSFEETLATTPAAAPDVPTAGAGFMAAARDMVRASELDAAGTLALGGYVHRTSAASGQLLGAAGITPGYLRENGRGFATFEIRLELFAPRPRAGAFILVESALARLGTSSLQMLHRVRDAASGRLLARGSQSGAHFDLKTRRSTPIPDALREKAAPYVTREAT